MAANKKFNVEEMLKPANAIEPKENMPEEVKTASEGKNEANLSNNKSSLRKPQKKTAEIDENEYFRQTYYINKKHIGAIELIAFNEHKDKSEVIRDIIDNMIKDYDKKNPGFEQEVIDRGSVWTRKERSKKI